MWSDGQTLTMASRPAIIWPLLASAASLGGPLSSFLSTPATDLSPRQELFPSGLKSSACNVLAIPLAPTSSDLSSSVPSSGKARSPRSGLSFYGFIVPFSGPSEAHHNLQLNICLII